MSVANSSILNPRSSILKFQALPPLSLYIHIPWCVRKCPYCDFNSHQARGEVPEARYVEALVRDLESALPSIWRRQVYTVFFGGGTPSLLSAWAIDDILTAVRARLPLAADAEITLEANPGTFEAEKFRDFRAAGVNRLSIGIQSFNPRHLQALGRIHDDAQARRAIEIAQRHFDNINLDIMYGLPRQTPEEARTDIAEAISHAPQHISAYHLTLEPNTYFYRYPPPLPDDDATAAMQAIVGERLAQAGYQRYEVSAYARPDRRAKHNLNYWLFGDYLGIGAGAHGKLSFPDRVVRQLRYKQPNEYMEKGLAGNAIQTDTAVAVRELPFEFMMNALRLVDGFPVSLFVERTGLQLTAALCELDEAERRGLIVRDHTRIAPTALGLRFLNDLLQIFLTPEDHVPHPVTEP